MHWGNVNVGNGPKDFLMNNRKQYEFNYCKAGVSYAEGSSWDVFEADDLVYLGGSILMLQQRG